MDLWLDFVVIPQAHGSFAQCVRSVCCDCCVFVFESWKRCLGHNSSRRSSIYLERRVLVFSTPDKTHKMRVRATFSAREKLPRKKFCTFRFFFWWMIYDGKWLELVAEWVIFRCRNKFICNLSNLRAVQAPLIAHLTHCAFFEAQHSSQSRAVICHSRGARTRCMKLSEESQPRQTSHRQSQLGVGRCQIFILLYALTKRPPEYKKKTSRKDE